MTIPIHYLLMNPTGNRTILVETDIPEEKQPDAASRLMQLEPTAEQVGFLTHLPGCDISLRMAGGEFCGNAAMSAAVYTGIRRKIQQGKAQVCISGTDHPVEVTFAAAQDGIWEGIVDMPHPKSIQYVSFSGGQSYPVISFQGITHVILETDLPCSDAETVAVRWCRELNAKALGLMFLNREQQSLTPLVYVPAADTLFWESTCASGTTAVGAWLASESGRDFTMNLRQPGGTLEIHASPDGPLQLKGSVSCIYEKTVAVDP